MIASLESVDKAIWQLINQAKMLQEAYIELTPSESDTSLAVIPAKAVRSRGMNEAEVKQLTE